MQEFTPLVRCGDDREIEIDSERAPDLTGQIVNAGGDLVSTSVGFGRSVGSAENGGYQSGGGAIMVKWFSGTALSRGA